METATAIKQFVEECVEKTATPEGWVRDFYVAFLEWGQAKGTPLITMHKFTRALRGHVDFARYTSRYVAGGRREVGWLLHAKVKEEHLAGSMGAIPASAIMGLYAPRWRYPGIARHGALVTEDATDHEIFEIARAMFRRMCIAPLADDARLRFGVTHPLRGESIENLEFGPLFTDAARVLACKGRALTRDRWREVIGRFFDVKQTSGHWTLVCERYMDLALSMGEEGEQR